MRYKDPIRICILDDHALVREALAELLGNQPDVNVVSSCGTIEEALRAVSTQPVDLILLDLQLAESTSLPLLEELQKSGFGGRVLVLAAVVSDEEAFRLMCLGAAGIVLKAAPSEVLLTAIRKIAAGELWCDQELLRKLLKQVVQHQPPSRTEVFTPREKSVLHLLLEGLSNKEIGGRMDLPESSVKSVMQSLFSKAGVHSRAQLVRVALERFQNEL